jgi:DNA polymerase
MLQPDVILVLGRHALTRLLPGAGGITRNHGQRIRRGDRTYVPLYHPAAALYNASLMDTLTEDMQRVRGYLADAEAERSARVHATSDEIMEAPADQLALF